MMPIGLHKKLAIVTEIDLGMQLEILKDSSLGFYLDFDLVISLETQLGIV
jgi:hypothetical protein